MHADDTNQDEEESIEPFYRIDDDGHFTWTNEGLQSYRKRFARFGIRIEAITTFEDYRTAMQLSARVFVEDTLEQLAERAQGKPWHELLKAALVGDNAALERAQRRYATHQTLKLIQS